MDTKLEKWLSLAIGDLRGETTKRSLAKQAGLSRVTIIRSESRCDLRVSSLEKIASGLGVSLSGLILHAERLRSGQAVKKRKIT